MDQEQGTDPTKGRALVLPKNPTTSFGVWKFGVQGEIREGRKSVEDYWE